MKDIFIKLRDRMFPRASELIAQEISSVDQSLRDMEARASEYERLAAQLREGVRNIRGGRAHLREAA